MKVTIKPTSPVTAGNFAAEPIEIPPPEACHKGFDIRWDGWVKPSNRHNWIGQWVACKEGCWNVYSSYPGRTDKFYGDQLFCTEQQDGQDLPIYGKSGAEDLDKYKMEAFFRLIDYINTHYEELPYEQKKLSD
jgi:hypothetical protein